MNSGSDSPLSMEELRRRNMQKPSAETQHPTAEEWMELTAALTAMRDLLLEEMSARLSSWVTKEQSAELIREAKEIRRLLEQAGKKRERCFSLPVIRLPRPLLEWLLLPAALAGLLVL